MSKLTFNDPAEWPAFVFPAYNRPEELDRLLASFVYACDAAKFTPRAVVSIDGDDRRVIEVAKKYQTHGVEVRVQGKRLGLRAHILQCGDLCREFGSVVVLEDDLILSPAAFDFIARALPDASKTPEIAAVSLYNFQYNEFGGFPITSVLDASSVAYAKTASSWGQIWWNDKWTEFRDWLDTKYDENADYEVPERVKNWPDTSWKKLFNYWMADSGYYSLFPTKSLAICTSGATGTHMSGIVNVSFSEVRSLGNMEIIPTFEEGTKLDAFLELDTTDLTDRLRDPDIPLSDIEFDLAGTKRVKNIRKPYVLTRRKQLASRLEASFDLDLGNPVLAVLLGIEGTGLFLVTKANFDDTGQMVLSDKFIRLQLPWLSTKRFTQAAIGMTFKGMSNVVRRWVGNLSGRKN